MNELKLFIVEDDIEFRESYSKQIKIFNLEQDHVIVSESFANDLNSAIEILSTNTFFDAAIIDLKLGNDDVTYKGNELVNLIRNNLRFPAFVVTANPEMIEKEKGNENDLFKVKVKGTNNAIFLTILDELKKIHLTGITKILGKSGQIESYLNKIFWEHLTSSIDIWASDNSRTPEQKEKSLLRYTLSHIQEHLELTEESNFENYHPAEIYITPTIKPNVFTGDIVKEKNTQISYIVLTPSCDLAYENKVEDVLLVKIEENNTGLMLQLTSVINNENESKGIKKDSEKKIKQLIGNNFNNKYHFLPNFKSLNGGLINFQQIKTVKKQDIKENFTIEASVNINFTKDIVARFSYYYSRQGSPDFNINEVYDSLIK
jgi:CheY-like chemotaxis protein